MDLKILKDIPPWDWPEDASKMFLEVLRNDGADESDRLLAAELGGDSVVINDELATALLSIVRSDDETEKLRGKAAIALGPALENADTYGFEDPDDIIVSEKVFRDVQEPLRKLFADAEVPKYVRRRILEASVRAPQDWHEGAIQEAYSSNDEDWKLTAVFCMHYIPGFDDLILDALNSKSPGIRYEAVCAAGSWGVDAAWPHISSLIAADETDKPLLLAAIEAVGSIRPHEAMMILSDFINSDDEDIAEAVMEAMTIAEGLLAAED
jgi:hypothetical protein